MDRIKVLCIRSKSKVQKGPQIYVSRTHPELVKKTF